MIKNLLRRKRKAKKDIFETGEFNMNHISFENLSEERDIMVSLLYANDFINTIYPACASCYGISCEKNKTYEERLSYIGRRVKSHHTSILEHSNVIIQAFIPLTKYNAYDTIRRINENIHEELSDISTTNQDIITLTSEVRDVCRYLTIHTDIIKDYDEMPIMRMTIGGSIRGFRYIFENIDNRKNKLFISIFNVLKLAVPKELFIDYINDGVMEEYSTIDTAPFSVNIPKRLNNINDDMIDIISMDNLTNISDILKLEHKYCFDFVSITTDFKNMSRIITQQLTRHRNGITQESQRYVNYSNSKFNSPDLFKDKYDHNTKYDTPIGKNTMEDLGYLITQVYNSLVAQGVDKEDARGFLPLNVQSGNTYITFTLRTLCMFLHLRLDSHAQAEIRKYAERLAKLTGDILGSDYEYKLTYYLSNFVMPRYMEDFNFMPSEEV